MKKTPGASFLRNRAPAVYSVRALVLAQRGTRNEAVAESGKALEAQRTITKVSGAAYDVRLDLAGQLLRHAEALTRCGELEPADDASREADGLLQGLDGECRRWIWVAYQSAAYRFALASAQESAAKGSDNGRRMRAASGNYGEAARLGAQWQSGKPYLQQRVAEAAAGRNRCARPWILRYNFSCSLYMAYSSSVDQLVGLTKEAR